MADPGGNNSRLPAGALFSTAFPPVGVAAGALDSTGTEMLPLNLDASGNLKVAGNFTATLGGTTAVNLVQVGGTPIVLGQAVMAASIPVVLASNQSNVTVAALQVGTWTVNFAPGGTSLRGSATASSTSAVVIIAAQGSTTKIYVTGLQFGNTSGSTIVVTLNDTAASQFIVPSGGGNNPSGFLVPLVLATANTSLTFTPSLAVATVYANAQGYGAS